MPNDEPNGLDDARDQGEHDGEGRGARHSRCRWSCDHNGGETRASSKSGIEEAHVAAKDVQGVRHCVGSQVVAVDGLGVTVLGGIDTGVSWSVAELGGSPARSLVAL